MVTSLITTTWLVLFTQWEPAPTFMVVDTFNSQQQCEQAKHDFVVEEKLDEKKARKLQCMTITTSKIGDS